MQLYLAATPDKLRQAVRCPAQPAHVAYRVGREGRLTRQRLPAEARGGLMVLGDQDCGPIRDSQALCRDVWRECSALGFTGVLADFERPVSPDRAAFLAALSQVLSRNRLQLFVPEAYGPKAPQANVLICTALSGGTLSRRLEDAARRFGVQRLALDLQRLRMVFPLPCPSGEGKPLSGSELRALLEQRQPPVFYSADLCAKYFTYARDKATYFVLFDDADTLRKKLRLGQSMGIGAAFLMYPEVEDLLPRLFPAKQGPRS